MIARITPKINQKSKIFNKVHFFIIFSIKNFHSQKSEGANFLYLTITAKITKLSVLKKIKNFCRVKNQGEMPLPFK